MDIKVCCEAIINTAHAQAGPYERTWKSDELISESLRAARPLPCQSPFPRLRRTGIQVRTEVLDPVHPSFYPVIHRRTRP